MKALRITNIQRGCVYDGPGVRTTVFLKGCTLHCPWCCNPETIKLDQEYFIDDKKCLLFNGVNSSFCLKCERNGGNDPITICPLGVTKPVSRDYRRDELLHILLQDKSLYKCTQGGVTFSGGEPLLHADDLLPLIIELGKHEITVCFETSLFVPSHSIMGLISYTDTFIVDYKLQPQSHLYDNNYEKIIMRNRLLLCGKPIIERMVYVNEMWKEKEVVVAKMKEIGILKLELLICHNLGQVKYKKLGIIYNPYKIDVERAKSFCVFLNDNGINTNILKL